MDDFFSTSLAVIIGVGLALGVLTMVVFGALTIDRSAAPFAEETRTRTYEESRAHVAGTVEHLQRLKLEYAKARGDAHREAIAEMALTEMTTIHPDHLPEATKRWLESLMNQYWDPDVIADSLTKNSQNQ